MKLATLLAALFLMFMLYPPTSATQSMQKPEALAQKSAEAWLALTDSGKYAESWEEAASVFKSNVGKDQWVTMVGQVRKPLGKVVSRTFKSAKYTTSLPGVPDGQYVVIQFTTSFENKKDAVETITPMLDKDGKWRVAGYFIR